MVSRPWINRLFGKATGVISGKNDIVLDGKSIVIEA